MQEICVDLILPEACALGGFDFKRTVLELNGQLYPQDLVQAQFEYFSLVKGPLPKFVIDKLPAGLREQLWQCISITANDDQLAAGLLKPIDIYTADSYFAELLQQFTALASSWILVFTTRCDEPDEIVEGDLSAALQKVEGSLLSNEGFIIYQDH